MNSVVQKIDNLHGQKGGKGEGLTRSIFLRPFSTDSLRVFLILFVMLRDISGQGVVWIRCTEECLYG
jgi:hypothetical protein